jgi:hypothetical protein
VTVAEFYELVPGGRSYEHPVVVRWNTTLDNARLDGDMRVAPYEVGVLYDTPGKAGCKMLLPIEEVELLRCRPNTLEGEVDS